MTKTKKDITILAIGDRPDFDSYAKFDREEKFLSKNDFEYATVDYKHFLKGKIPSINTKKIIVFLFFPFSYWNKHIEHKNYKGIYGNQTFYNKFMRFWNLINRCIKKYLNDKEVLFINTPKNCGINRDKLELNKRLIGSDVLQPPRYKINNKKQLHGLLTNGNTLFIKPRFGSMGKGITFLSNGHMKTNFTFKNNKIISKKSDRGWKFKEISKKDNFLRQLIKKDMLVEKGLKSLLIKNQMIDLRVYTFFKKIIYIYPRRNAPENITTNISQGARGDPELLRKLPKHLIEKAKNTAVQASKMLDLNFAGIDIILGKNRKDVFVIDVNVFPGFPKRRTFNLSRNLVNTLAELNKSGKLQFNRTKGR